MAATEFQTQILKRLARLRIDGGETYVAGGLALNQQLGTPRVSRDIDIFNDSEEAVASAFGRDTALLAAAGYEVKVKREKSFLREVSVSLGGQSCDVQWAHDSAFRFFPLVEDPVLGLALHPFDLATNKMLALVGRHVPRDFIDAISCHERIQPLPFLLWAACGKDPGFSPSFILEFAARTHYVQEELDMEEQTLGRLDAAALSRKWHEMLWAARATLAILPPEEAGKCVANADGTLFRGSDAELREALGAGRVVFHEGCLGGAWPRVVD